MKVLDLFCGKGGWSIPFIEDGCEVVGVDIVNLKYPGRLLLADIRQLGGKQFQGFDFIVGSPPCTEFSTLTNISYKRGHRGPPNPGKGLELISHFNRIVSEAHPRFWAMESTRRTEKFYPIKPIWRFRMGKTARRSLWGNLNIPLARDFVFPNRRLNAPKRKLKVGEKRISSRDFAMIPYPIARFIADCVKVQVVT